MILSLTVCVALIRALLAN